MIITLLIINLLATGLVFMAAYQTWRDVGKMRRDVKRWMGERKWIKNEKI